MVCYIIPAIAAIIEFLRAKKSKNSLNLMFLGGALFGIVDHLWNGELFLISKNWLMDLTLGFTITGVITGSWFMIVSAPKIIDSMHRLSSRLGISN